jgi:hypothetical protein
MKGRWTYQTKVGAFMSFAYLAVIFLALLYFITKFLDKSNPTLQYTTYRDPDWVKTDIIEDDFNVMFLPMTKRFEVIPPEKFFKSFAVYSTISELWINAESIDNNASALPAVPCSKATWVINLLAKAKAAGNTTLYREVADLAPDTICIDAPKLRIMKGLDGGNEVVSSWRIEMN